jgi:hypothetical protein
MEYSGSASAMAARLDRSITEFDDPGSSPVIIFKGTKVTNHILLGRVYVIIPWRNNNGICTCKSLHLCLLAMRFV